MDLLVPRPREVSRRAEEFALPPRLTMRGLATPAGRWLSGELKRLGFELRGSESEAAEIHLLLKDDPLEDDPTEEGYRLDVTASGIHLVAGSPHGLFNAAVTLVQWLELHRGAGDGGRDGGRPRRLGGIQIRDRPSFAVRGVMLDISRDKVPRLETLLALIDLFARLKINQLQLYMEHTFAYQGHEEVWRDASPLTAADVRRLGDYCAERYIDLVPNQQSFGHMHRWLVHPGYRHLAECPDGIDHPFSLEPEPFSLCPLDPRSLALLADLYDRLLPNFRGQLFNVGCDETLDLGLGRSKVACDEHGKTRVYLDFLRQVHGLAAERGRRIQFWGDIILRHPDLIADLPDDVIALEWGYEADHPFEQDCGYFAASGREFYVCPGTSSWNSFAGRTNNAVENLAQAAIHGHAHGAAGYLITDWGDFGHLQPLTASYPGFVAGAAFAWNVESARRPSELPLASLLDRHVYRGDLAGRMTTELGNTYLRLKPTPLNGSALFFLVVFALLERERERTAGVTLDNLDQAMEHLASTTAGLAALDLDRPDADLVARELAWSADIQIFACRLGRARWRGGDLSSLAGVPSAERQDLARELRTLIERHRENFMERNRPGGWERSSGWLQRVVDLL